MERPDAAGDPRPWLVAVAGWMASGKSTLSHALARALDAERIEADRERERAAEEGEPEAMAPGFSEQLYPELLERAGGALAEGRSVVLDASFRRRRYRADAAALAARHGARFLLVECRVPEAVCRDRLRARERTEPGWLAMFDAFLARWEPITSQETALQLAVDGTAPPPENARRVADAMARQARRKA